jgi:hypothetical protein
MLNMFEEEIRKFCFGFLRFGKDRYKEEMKIMAPVTRPRLIQQNFTGVTDMDANYSERGWGWLDGHEERGRMSFSSGPAI